MGAKRYADCVPQEFSLQRVSGEEVFRRAGWVKPGERGEKRQ